MIFTDVSRDHKDWEAIDYISELLPGMSFIDGSFRPEDPITLGEICLILSRLFPSNNTNIDSLPGHWALGYAEYCKTNGLCPADLVLDENSLECPVTKEQIYSILRTIMDKESRSSGFIKKEFPTRVPARENECSRAFLAEVLREFGKAMYKNMWPKIQRNLKNETYADALKILDRYMPCVYFLPADIRQAYRRMIWFQGSDALAVCSFSFMIRIIDCKKKHFMPISGERQILHYTTLNGLEGLSRKHAKLRLNHVNYLNDPEEGYLGFHIAKDRLKKYTPFREWKQEEIKEVFIASFSTSQNKKDIPMWVHYGDKARGCIIEFKASQFEEEIYGVCYANGRSTTSKDIFSEYLNDIESILDEYLLRTSQTQPDEYDPVFLFAKDAVGQACYLYKSSNYAYEREARIVSFLPLCEAKALKEVREGEVFPRIYAETQKEIKISSITLGPKVENREQIIVALAQRGIDTSEIEESHLPYR